jgi:phosphoglycolate phosphatase-like HAD superfamily hydrolase
MQPSVLLFDVDGTLVTTGGVGRRALEIAFERSFGRRDACKTFRLDGMTDRAIVRTGMRAIGIEPTEALIDQVLVDYLLVLADEVAAAPDETYRVHAGMAETVDRARSRREVAVGLGTGNVREGARIKLERVGIYDRFPFGGFGCDAEDRIALIRRGAERGAALLGAPVEECRVVIIGDTPKDVAAAQAIGAECVGVGTGSFTAEQLVGAGATCAFPDLATPGAMEVVLGALR